MHPNELLIVAQKYSFKMLLELYEVRPRTQPGCVMGYNFCSIFCKNCMYDVTRLGECYNYDITQTIITFISH